MEQADLGQIPTLSKLENFSKEELITRYQLVANELARVIKENYDLRGQQISDEQIQILMDEQLGELRNVLFGASSERYKKPETAKKKPLPHAPRIKKPSERYPNVPVREVVLTLNPLPNCDVCGSAMSESGMTEDSEQLTVIPKKYEILRQKRMKYRCGCQACLLTTPVPARIIPGSSYSDEMIQDVALSKYCDLIPMERYVGMAARGGLMDLPPQSLIGLTHDFADFVQGAVDRLKSEAMRARVLQADETPHRMLEGSKTKSWYLWGFSTPEVCFLECHDTRSGDVASEILLKSQCEVLVTDVYSGYGKAIKVANKERIFEGRALIQNAHCNAHARRYFFKSRINYPEAEYYLEQYHQVYQLNGESKGNSPPEILELRSQMRVRFEAMRQRAFEELPRYPSKNQYQKALNYFLENYAGLTRFLTDAQIPMDNNAQERLLRSHVVGRKTWYGTHSERGAKTAGVMFSLVETCKLNDVNPREYFENLVQDLLLGQNAYTPKEFKDLRHS